MEFFGEKARMMGGPAALAAQTGAALMPAILWFEGDDWGVHVHEEIPVPAEGDSRQQAAAMMQEVARLFEAGIRAHPQDWHMLQKVPGRAIAALVMIVGIGLIGTVSATVAAWFVTRPGATGGSEAGPADNADQPTSPDATPPVLGADDTRAVLLGRLDALAAEQREIRRLLKGRAT